MDLIELVPVQRKKHPVNIRCILKLNAYKDNVKANQIEAAKSEVKKNAASLSNSKAAAVAANKSRADETMLFANVSGDKKEPAAAVYGDSSENESLRIDKLGFQQGMYPKDQLLFGQPTHHRSPIGSIRKLMGASGYETLMTKNGCQALKWIELVDSKAPIDKDRIKMTSELILTKASAHIVYFKNQRAEVWLTQNDEIMLEIPISKENEFEYTDDVIKWNYSTDLMKSIEISFPSFKDAAEFYDHIKVFIRDPLPIVSNEHVALFPLVKQVKCKLHADQDAQPMNYELRLRCSLYEENLVYAMQFILNEEIADQHVLSLDMNFKNGKDRMTYEAFCCETSETKKFKLFFETSKDKDEFFDMVNVCLSKIAIFNEKFLKNKAYSENSVFLCIGSCTFVRNSIETYNVSVEIVQEHEFARLFVYEESEYELKLFNRKAVLFLLNDLITPNATFSKHANAPETIIYRQTLPNGEVELPMIAFPDESETNTFCKVMGTLLLELNNIYL